MLRWLALVVVLTLCAPACASSLEPRTIELPEPGVGAVSRLDMIFDYRSAVATIASIVERELGLQHFPVTFEFYPHRGAFERALLDAGYDPQLARSTAKTMIGIGGHRKVLLNDGELAAMPWPDRVLLLAHELGHSLQYELGGGRRGASDQWLREGFADWLAVRVLERLNAVSAPAVRRQRHDVLRRSGRAQAMPFADLVTFPQWVKAGERSGEVLYAQSFLAVDFLIGRRGLRAVLGYFQRFASSDDRAANFRAAFGEDLDAFEAAFAAQVLR